MAPGTEDSEEGLDADVQEFARHERSGGWAQALLVARRVEKGEGSGVGFEQESTKRHGRDAFRRISAKEFARRAGTSANRVLAFLDAWERAAADGLVLPSAELTRSVQVDLPDEEVTPFYGEQGYYRSYQARMPAGERREALEAEAENGGIRPHSAVYAVQHPGAVKAAILADASLRAVAIEAIEEHDRRGREAQEEAERAAAQRQRDAELSGSAGQWSPQPAGDEEEGMTPAQAEAAVRAVAQPVAVDAALHVFNELAQVRLGTLRILTLLQQQNIQFTDDRSQAISELCEASKAAIDFIRDLSLSSFTALDDEALRAFLDESEKLG